MEWEDPPAGLNDHVVICNCNEKVKNIVEELQADTVKNPPDVVLLVHDEDLWLQHPEWQPRQTGGRARFVPMLGSPTRYEDLRRAQMRTAEAAVILADPNLGRLADARSTLIAVAIERLNPAVHTILELVSSQNKIHLEETCVDEVVCLGEISERMISQSCITPGIKNLFQSLLTTAKGTNQIFVIPVPPALHGTTYRQLAKRAIINEAPFVLCGFIRSVKNPEAPDEIEKSYAFNPRVGDDPGKDSEVDHRDELVLIATEVPDLEKYLSPTP